MAKKIKQEETWAIFWVIIVLAIVDIAMNLLAEAPLIGPLIETMSEVVIEGISGALVYYMIKRR